LVPLIEFLLLLLFLLRAAFLHRRSLTHQRMRLLLRSLVVSGLRTAIFLRLHIPVRRLLRTLDGLSPPTFGWLRRATFGLRRFRLVVGSRLRIRHLSNLIVTLIVCVIGLCEWAESILRLPVILIPILRPIHWTH
jgi:hypothetical protein